MKNTTKTAEITCSDPELVAQMKARGLVLRATPGVGSGYGFVSHECNAATLTANECLVRGFWNAELCDVLVDGEHVCGDCD